MKKYIRVGGVPEHFNLPWHLAVESGAFAEIGLDLEFIQYPTGTGAMCQDLRDGKIDLAVALTEGLLMDMARYQETVMVSPYVLSSLRWGIHVATDSALQSPSDLKDRTFAVSRMGSGSHLMALLWAQEQGWNPQELKLKPIGGLEPLEKAILEGQADAFLWEVFTTLPRVKQGRLRALGEIKTPWPCFMIAGRPEWLNNNQADVHRLLGVLFVSTAARMEAVDETLQAVSERYGLSLDESREWFTDVRWANSADLPLGVLQSTLEALSQLKLIGPLPDLSEVIWQPNLAYPEQRS